MKLLKLKKYNFSLEILGLFSFGVIIAVIIAYLSVFNTMLLFLILLGDFVVLIFAFKFLEPELSHDLSKKSISQKQPRDLSNVVSDANFIEQQVNSLIAEQEKYLTTKDSEIKQLNLFVNTTLYIRQYLNTDKILRTTAEKIQEVFDVERVIICRFNHDCSGTILIDFSADGCQQIKEKQIRDMCFDKRQKQKYRNGYVNAINDIDQSELAECYISLLKSLDVKATLVAPILQGKILFGLLIAHQCHKARDWKKWEVNLFKQLGIQVGTALDLAHQYEQAIEARLNTESLLEEAKRMIKQESKTKNNYSCQYKLEFSNRIKTLVHEILNSHIEISELNKTTTDIALTSYRTLESIYKNIECLSLVINKLQEIKSFNQDRDKASELIFSINKNDMQISALALNLGLNNSGENVKKTTMIAQEISRISAESSQIGRALEQILENFKIHEIGDVEKTVLRLLADGEVLKTQIINSTKIISAFSKANEILQSQNQALSSISLLSNEILEQFQLKKADGRWQRAEGQIQMGTQPHLI